MPDSEAALFYINDLAAVGGAAAGTTGTAITMGACSTACGMTVCKRWLPASPRQGDCVHIDGLRLSRW